ncbi:MAG TPA: RDD family protein [Acidimicrobiales bacterium]|nr:RDD family protein [Acidimicrobiales bacterium]
MTLFVEPTRDLSLQGHYAGIGTRLAAFGIDVVTLVVLFDILGNTVQYLVSTLSGTSWKISDLPAGGGLAIGILAFLYCTYPVAAGGRTFGMAVAGLRVVRPDGSPVGWFQAVVRILALPLSFLTLGVGFLLILLRQDHRALQDLIGGTAVVYAWDARAARWRFLADSEPAPDKTNP